MKSIVYSWLSLLLIFGWSSCCLSDDEGPLIQSTEFIFTDSTGEIHLYGIDGIYEYSEFVMTHLDDGTNVNILTFGNDDEVQGLFRVQFKRENATSEQGDAYIIHYPDGIKDTLTVFYETVDGDRCSNSYLSLSKVLLNNIQLQYEDRFRIRVPKN